MPFDFRYEPAEDESVDSQYVLTKDGKDTNIAIQDARSYGGGWSVHSYACGTDGHVVSMTIKGEYRSLKAAKEAAIKLGAEQ